MQAPQLRMAMSHAGKHLKHPGQQLDSERILRMNKSGSKLVSESDTSF